MKKKRKVSMTAKIAAVAFSIYAAFTLVSLQLQIRTLERGNAGLQEQVAQQTLVNSEIQDVLNGEDSLEYIAAIARQKLGYVSPGERVFVDISSK